LWRAGTEYSGSLKPKRGERAMANDEFIGTWNLVSFETRNSDGAVTYSFGEDAEGVLVYDASRNFAGQVSRNDRPHFGSSDIRDGSIEEIRAAYAGYIAYFGKFEIDEAERYLIHRVQESLFPNWRGDSQKRYYELSDRRLVLQAPPTPFRGENVTGVLVWRRAT